MTRMADVSELRFSVDISEARQAAADLERLAAAVHDAESSIDGLIKIVRGNAMSPSAIEVTTSIDKMTIKHRIEL